MSADVAGDLNENGLSDGVVIDCEVHVTAPADDVATYCQEPYRTRLQSSSAFPKDPGSDWRMKQDQLSEGDRLTDPERVRTNVCKRFGIDAPLLSVASGIEKLPNDDVATQLMRAYNDYLLDRFLDDSGFYGLMEVTTQDPKRAAEELDRLGDEDQIVGALVGTTGPTKPLGHPRYDVLYRTAEENDLPIVFHSAAGPHFRHDYPKQNQGLRSSFAVDTLSHFWSQTLTFCSLVVEGVPEKFPDLEFVFQEVGLSWVPYLTWRLNKEYSMQKPQAPLLTKSPEEYVRESCYFTHDPIGAPVTPTDVGTVAEIIGPTSVLLGTNSPYSDIHDQTALQNQLETMFGPEEISTILIDTPAQVFGINQ